MLEGRGETYEAHGFAHDEDEGLVGDGLGGGEEEEGDGDVEEAEGADDGACADEGHDGYLLEKKTPLVKRREGSSRWSEWLLVAR